MSAVSQVPACICIDYDRPCRKKNMKVHDRQDAGVGPLRSKRSAGLSGGARSMVPRLPKSPGAMLTTPTRFAFCSCLRCLTLRAARSGDGPDADLAGNHREYQLILLFGQLAC